MVGLTVSAIDTAAPIAEGGGFAGDHFRRALALRVADGRFDFTPVRAVLAFFSTRNFQAVRSAPIKTSSLAFVRRI